jgi:hypothetical protein
MTDGPTPHIRQEPLPGIVTHLLEECRMVLPGIQALFGFQLIAVFNSVFWERLSKAEHRVHLLAIALVAIAIAFVMTPAAYHRQAEPESVSHRFVAISSRFLLWSMFPLMTGISLDFYLIGKLVLDDPLLSALLTSLLLTAFVVPWFILPRITRLQSWLGNASRG